MFHSYEEIYELQYIYIYVFTLHITTNVQTLCWNKTSPSFSGAHISCISRSINTNVVPHIGMYTRINISKTDFIYLNIWCDSKYITIQQLNEWVKQFTLSVNTITTFTPCTYKWVFSNTCVYYPVP